MGFWEIMEKRFLKDWAFTIVVFVLLTIVSFMFIYGIWFVLGVQLSTQYDQTASCIPTNPLNFSKTYNVSHNGQNVNVSEGFLPCGDGILLTNADWSKQIVLSEKLSAAGKATMLKHELCHFDQNLSGNATIVNEIECYIKQFL